MIENTITFITMVIPGKATLKALMMANSLRTFGGELSDSLIWFLVPAGRESFSDLERQAMDTLMIHIQPFEVAPELLNFPFAAKILAASQAEAALQGSTECLAWLDLDTIILRQPDELRLNTGKCLAYRPVHHKLIGPAWDEPLDPFWELVYRSCRVPEGRQFPMVTHTGQKIRPYFNAGSFVTRTASGLMARWQNIFQQVYQKPEFLTWYQASELYTIFIHQAIFTGVILQTLEPHQLQELSPRINYPLHLHNEVPAGQRPTSLDELTTLRYENTFDSPTWPADLPILAPLQAWLQDQALLSEPSKS
jgi:hypothetical protein